MKISEEDFWNVYDNKDYRKIEEAFDNGLGFDFDINDAILQASYAQDKKLMYILWKNKAPAPTEYIKEIFKAFDRGQTHFSAETETSYSIEALDGVFIDSINCELTDEIKGVQDSELCLSVNLYFPRLDKRFLLEYYVLLDDRITEGLFAKGYSFDLDEVDPASIYLEGRHIPVDLKYVSVDNNGKGANVRLSLDLSELGSKHGCREIKGKTNAPLKE